MSSIRKATQQAVRQSVLTQLDKVLSPHKGGPITEAVLKLASESIHSTLSSWAECLAPDADPERIKVVAMVQPDGLGFAAMCPRGAEYEPLLDAMGPIGQPMELTGES